MDRRPLKWFTSALVFLAAAVLFAWLISFGAILWPAFQQWLNRSRSPDLAVLSVSAALLSVLWFVYQRKMEVPFLDKLLPKPNPLAQPDPAARYFFGLPDWTFAITAALALGAMFFNAAPCQPPVVSFHFSGGGQDRAVQRGDVLELPAGSSFTLEVSPLRGQPPPLCQWYSAGEVVKRITRPAECATLVELDPQPGQAALTVAVKGSFCPIQDLHNFPLRTDQP